MAKPSMGNLYGHGHIEGKPHRLTLPRKGRKATASHGRREVRNPKPAAKPVDPLEALVAAAVQQQYGGQQQALAQRQANIPAYYQQYQDQIVRQKAQTDALYAQQIAANQAAQTQAGQGPQLGPGVSADTAAQAQLAAQSRAGMVGQFGQALGGAQAAQGALYGGLATAGSAAQLSDQMRAAQDQQALAREIGAAKVSTRQSLQDQQAKQALEQQVFGLNVQKEQDTVANQQRQSQDKARQRRATARGQRAQREATAQNQAADRASREKIAQQKQQQADAKAHSKAQEAHRKTSNKAIDRLDTITNDYGRLSNSSVTETLPDGKTRTRKPTRDEVIARLRSEGFSANEIHLALRDQWDDRDVRIAHRMGIIVADSGRKRKLSRGKVARRGNRSKQNRPDTAGNPNV